MRTLSILVQFIIVVGSVAVGYFYYRISFTAADGLVGNGYIFGVICLTAGIYVLTWLSKTLRQDNPGPDSGKYWYWSDFARTALVVIVIATSGFVEFSIALYRSGIGTIEGGPVHGAHLIDITYNTYLWHLANTVPLLQITNTMNWKLGHTYTDRIQGGLIILYTLSCIIPVLYLGKKSINAWSNRPPDFPIKPLDGSVE